MPNQVIDPWTWLDFKPTFGEARASGGFFMPSWIGEHSRRLRAYKMLDSYARNAARFWMSGEMTDEERDTRREYGDTATLLGQIRTSLLGIDQSIVVGDTEEERRSGNAQLQRTALREWADLENFDLKVMECEGKAINLGDGVYVLGWDPDAERPRLEVWDPGFYFPVLDPRQATDQYPRRVHMAYEYEEEQADGAKRKYVRRITWELIDDEDEDGNEIMHVYPWNAKDTSTVCVMTDATWLIDDLENNVDDFSMAKAMYEEVWDEVAGEMVELNQYPIDIDFIPVVHVPNVDAGAEHFGTSAASVILQVIDDLINTDTDLQAASATTGSPPITVSGGVVSTTDGEVNTYGPGLLIQTGDGTATMIDTSNSLKALLEYDDHLLSRLSVNGRVPESLMGRIKPSEVPSGIALSLSFAPHSALIGEMRTIRNKKYRLLFRFVARMYQQFSTWPGDEIIDAELKFGTFLPADRKETVDLVVQLLQTSPPAISLATAVRMLVEAGFPIEDAAAEVEAIIREDWETAAQVLDATADPNIVRKRMGLPLLTPDDLEEDEEDEEETEDEPPGGAA